MGSGTNSNAAAKTTNKPRRRSRRDTPQYTFRMNIRLSAIDARIIGSLIEKQITTPDQYPLSLNALVNACNQKSNREPLMQLDEATVKFAVDSLARRHFVVEKSGFGSRVPKYQQIFCNTEFGSLKFTPQETGDHLRVAAAWAADPGRVARPRIRAWPSYRTPASSRRCWTGSRTGQKARWSRNCRANPARRDSRWAQLFEELPEPTAVTAEPAAPGNSAARSSAQRAKSPRASRRSKAR